MKWEGLGFQQGLGWSFQYLRLFFTPINSEHNFTKKIVYLLVTFSTLKNALLSK
jgi:hypothetical protein